MVRYHNNFGRKLARSIAACQLGLIVLCALIFALGDGRVSAISAILGGLVCVLATSIFAWQHFRVSGGVSQARQMVNNFYKAECLKWVVTIVAFCTIWQWPLLQAEAMLTTFILAHMIFWLGPVLLKRN